MNIGLFVVALARGAAANAEPTPTVDDKVVVVSSFAIREYARFRLEPEYPAAARQFRVSGEVVADFTVGLDGKVEQVTIARGSPMFNAAVITAVKRWSFNPFVQDGHPTRAKSSLTFVFKR